MAAERARGTTAVWSPDVLGPGFEQLVLSPGGAPPSTLVRYRGSSRRWWRRPAVGTDVLYVHGWSDYFFQRPLAEFWHRAGARFYALDLHGFGRSLAPGQVPGDVSDLAEYDPDVDAALAAMGHAPAGDGDRGKRRLLLLGHSTGGLVMALWAARHPGTADALVLNSPWLEFQASEMARRAMAPLLGARARFFPHVPLPGIDPGHYARTVSADLEGEWAYNAAWRPEKAFALPATFLGAVFAGQERIAHGLALDVPVLVLLSDRSYLLPQWSPDAAAADVALNVDAVAHRALSLGENVTVVRVPGALHDVFLSRQAVRSRAYARVAAWTAGALRLGGPDAWAERVDGL
jgi:alpha-beta hydrolase superfamily lysophospholipase